VAGGGVVGLVVEDNAGGRRGRRWWHFEEVVDLQK
jgi:hypothetical protein